jgi:hypothetical protein
MSEANVVESKANGFVRRVAFGAGLLTVALSSGASAQNITRVSVDSKGVQGDHYSYSAACSQDGKIIAFASDATTLVVGDTNLFRDVFVHDLSTGVTTRVSVDSTGVEGNGTSDEPSISADGNLVAFWSNATNLITGDTNNTRDVFVHNRSTGVTECVSVDSTGLQSNGYSYGAAISGDGNVVAFHSAAFNLVANDNNFFYDIFVHDRTTGVTERVDVDSNGVETDDQSYDPAISHDGKIVTFWSDADNLIANDGNYESDVFVHDRTTGITERVSVDSSGGEGDSFCDSPAISADGNLVTFRGDASNLVDNDNNNYTDIFVHDRTTQVTERVSVSSAGVESNAPSNWPTISADGGVVAFYSTATNLVAGDANFSSDAFIHDRTTGITERMSVDANGVEGDNHTYYAVVAPDGQSVAFESNADNLVASDTNGASDVFRKEICSLAASWSNYGAGFPGTHGIPAFTSRNNPALGKALNLDLANSSGAAAAGLLFLGFVQTSIHSGWGGDLLVVPVATVPLSIPASGLTLSGTVPESPTLCGFQIDLQAFEGDPGAARGVSFTAGLELVLGR